MRARVVVALIVAAPLLVSGGCGDDDGGSKASGGDSVTEIESEAGSGASESDTTDSTTPDVTTPDGTDVSIPDFEGMEGLGDCLSQATAYASLAMSALGGDNAAQSAADAVDSLKAALPDELQDDLDVLAEGYRTVAEEGFIAGGEAMDTPEFNEADQHISDYFEETCGG